MRRTTHSEDQSFDDNLTIPTNWNQIMLEQKTMNTPTNPTMVLSSRNYQLEKFQVIQANLHMICICKIQINLHLTLKLGKKLEYVMRNNGPLRGYNKTEELQEEANRYKTSIYRQQIFNLLMTLPMIMRKIFKKFLTTNKLLRHKNFNNKT